MTPMNPTYLRPGAYTDPLIFASGVLFPDDEPFPGELEIELCRLISYDWEDASCAVDAMRSFELEEAMTIRPQQGPFPVASHYTNPLLDHLAENEQFERRVSAALGRLRHKSLSQYLVFLLCVIGDVPQDQLAEAWDVSPAAISRLKDRAMQTLQESTL